MDLLPKGGDTEKWIQSTFYVAKSPAETAPSSHSSIPMLPFLYRNQFPRVRCVPEFGGLIFRDVMHVVYKKIQYKDRLLRK